jgi:arabinogalactan endo-1,4-beta-galactosidase
MAEAGIGTDGDMPVEDASSESEVAEGGGLDASGRPDGGPSVLVNPSFEIGLSGWSFDPPTAMGKYAYTQFAQGVGATTIEGQNELATWSGNDAFTLRVFQAPANLPSGRYTLSAYFNRADGFNSAYIYAKNCGGPDRQANIPTTTATQWLQTQISGIEVTAGQCEVGFFVDSNPSDWLNADAFSFSQDPQ